jgi:signal transduction histidine kinase
MRRAGPADGGQAAPRGTGMAGHALAVLGGSLPGRTARALAAWSAAAVAAGGGLGLFAATRSWWSPATALLLLVPLVAVTAASRLLVRGSGSHQQFDRLSQANSRLRASLEGLRESNRLKDDFVAAVSHELRSPLTSIQGSLATLLRAGTQLDPTMARSLLEVADRQSRRLRRLIEDLLVVSRLESGEDRPLLGDVRLDVLVGQVLEDLAADGTQHLMETDMPAGLGPVRSDADRLHQILANLVGNARKYAPAGTTVTVRVRPGRTSTDVLVADQGPGIPHEARERIFERFYQADQSRTRQAGGIGLGLYLCRRLAASIGAEVVLERTGPDGSVFAVRLPHRPGVVPVPPAADHAYLAGVSTGGAGAPGRPGHGSRLNPHR